MIEKENNHCSKCLGKKHLLLEESFNNDSELMIYFDDELLFYFRMIDEFFNYNLHLSLMLSHDINDD